MVIASLEKGDPSSREPVRDRVLVLRGAERNREPRAIEPSEKSDESHRLSPLVGRKEERLFQLRVVALEARLLRVEQREHVCGKLAVDTEADGRLVSRLQGRAPTTECIDAERAYALIRVPVEEFPE